MLYQKIIMFLVISHHHNVPVSLYHTDNIGMHGNFPVC